MISNSTIQSAELVLCTGPEAGDGFAVDPAFSFAGHTRHLRGGMSEDKLRELLGRAGKQLGNDHVLMHAMRRGIGVHHSGLPLKYRQMAEILFRCGFLRVVIATGNCSPSVYHICAPVFVP